RKLCPTCKEVWMEAPADRLKKWIPKGTPLYRAAGCPDCAMTGYRGRFGIIEVLTVSAEVERRIAAGAIAEHTDGAAEGTAVIPVAMRPYTSAQMVKNSIGEHTTAP